MSILERLAAIAASKKNAPAKKAATKPITKPDSAENWATTPLSNIQKARISQLAAQAYKTQKYIDAKLEDWRRDEQEIACGKRSLLHCNQTHFLSLVAHFQALAGDTAASQETWKRTGRVKGSTILNDTHDNRKIALEKIMQALADHKEEISDWIDAPEPITYGYVLAIVKNQHKKPINELTAAQLQRLLFTVKNRITAREGKGETKNRNKSQRRKRK